EEVVRKFNNDIIPKFCTKLRCLTTWCTEKNFKDVESILSACPHLEALSLRSLPIDGNGTWSQVDGDPLFQLLANKAPENFSKLRIGGEWSFTPQALATFLSIRKIKEKPFTFCVCDCYDEAEALIEITPKHDETIRTYRACGILKYKYEFEFIGEFD
ncbi:6147_t:CDS:1, partial [Acaulospora colombiana]